MLGLEDNTWVGIGVVIIVILSLSIHEWAHAATAYRFGDDTAKRLGRLTINPLRHIDPIFTIIVPLIMFFTVGFVFGGAKPVPVDPSRLRHPARDMAIVAAAGPFSNMVLGFLCFGLTWFFLKMEFYGEFTLGNKILQIGGVANFLLGVFNLIPVPPLDGSRILAYLLPRRLAHAYLQIGSIGIFLVLALWYFRFLTPILSFTVFPLYYGSCDFLNIRPIALS